MELSEDKTYSPWEKKLSCLNRHLINEKCAYCNACVFLQYEVLQLFDTRVKVSHLVANLPTSRQQVVFALLGSMEQAVNNLQQACWYYQTCCKVVPASPIQSLLKPCVVNLVNILVISYGCIKLIKTTLYQVWWHYQTCYKLWTACSKLVTTTGNKQC
jgi:hypothetical protein